MNESSVRAYQLFPQMINGVRCMSKNVAQTSKNALCVFNRVSRMFGGESRNFGAVPDS